MKKLILIIALALLAGACEPDTRGYVQPDHQAIQEADYCVKFLFEVDGVKMYQFNAPSGYTVYFTIPASRTHYQYTQLVGKMTTHRDITCLNAQ